MTDLRSQIGTYLEETSIPVDVETLVTSQELRPGVAITPRRVRRRWHPAVVFVVAAVAVLLIGVPLLLFGVSRSAPVAEEPPVTITVPPATTAAPTTTTPSTTVTTTPVPPASPLPALGTAWEIVASGDEVPTMAVEFVADVGWIALGGPYVMVSADGRDWEHGDPDGVIIADAAFLSGVTAGGPGAIAWGRTCEGNGDFSWEPVPCEQEPVVYLSEDGVTWQRARNDAFIGCRGETGECYAGVESVAVAADGRIIAAGPDRTTGQEGAGYETDAVVWTSNDAGQTWVRHAIAPDDYVREGWYVSTESLTGLAHIGGRWIGFTGNERYLPDADDWENELLLLESDDGTTWLPVTTAEPFTVTWSVVELVRGPEGLVGILGDGLWTTTDGSAWQRGTLEDGGESGADLHRITALDSGFVVTGSETGSFLFSSDGVTWQIIHTEVLDSVAWNDIGGHGNTLTAVGYAGTDLEDGEQGAWQPAIWLWTE
jgi:hypothetical protein